jgi:CheY-like chemotaxis protein
MTQIVDDLLDVSRVTRGLVELALEPIEFKEVVAAAVEQCRPLLDARRQHLTLQLPAEALRVNGDRLRLVQVLGNILNNAAKYTQEGGEIAVRVEAQPKTLTVSVLDNGGGIAAELLPHVFDLFTQASRSAARTQGGLGLGLALVKRLVELHGGVVTAHSEGPGRGSEFVIQLPRRMSASTDRADFPPTSPDCQGDGCAPLKVLVVDDNTDAADVLATLLQLQGHDVDVAYDSQDALERARVETPHVVLLDIGLPGMDGYELARLLRQQRITASATLIAITGYGQAEDRQRSRDAGFDYHLTKPVDPEALSDLLRELARSTPSSG